MKAKQQLGQNFLMHSATARRIVMSARLPASSSVLEIGPGTGMLTKALLDAGHMVTAVETDSELIPVLAETFAQEIREGRLSLISGDIRTFNLQKYVKAFKNPKKSAQMLGANERESEPYLKYGKDSSDESNNADGLFSSDSYHVVANIPYYITGEILRYLLSTEHKPESITILVQKEVAVRVARSVKESILSLSVKAYGEPLIAFLVPRGAFRPSPKVDSAVLTIQSIRSPFKKPSEEKAFFDILHAGFGQKRKRLAKNLEVLYSKERIEEVFTFLNLSSNIRAEELPLSVWFSLLRKLKST